MEGPMLKAGATVVMAPGFAQLLDIFPPVPHGEADGEGGQGRAAKRQRTSAGGGGDGGGGGGGGGERRRCGVVSRAPYSTRAFELGRAPCRGSRFGDEM